MIGIIAAGYAQSIGGSQYDADAQAFITAAGITDDTQKSAIDTLVLSLKSNSLWAKMKAIYPMVGGTQSSHKWNLKDPRDLDAAFRLTFTGTLTHSNNGILGGGGYANTYLAQSVHLGRNDLHFSVYSRSYSAAGDKAAIGNAYRGGNNQSNLWIRTTTGMYMRACSDSTNAITTNQDTRGYYIVNRISSTEVRCQINNTLLVQTAASVTNNISSYFHIFAAAANNGDDRQFAFSTIGLGLSDIDMSNLYAAVQAFQTTLNRQV